MMLTARDRLMIRREWKEAIYNKAKNLRVRMYRPVGVGDASGNKLPMLIHFHGGGFCLGSCTWANVHVFCLRLAADAGAVVLSAGYHLALEHRLPAAVDEQSASPAAAGADAWLTEAADFGRVFVRWEQQVGEVGGGGNDRWG
ncbi:probable carboxylesterase 15 [Panicum virgatum]|uniref:probable carboxylesterase 15 n=1 Tax=Panicum virgatum TaxID=38727 RepID=UPI0019D50651|nr:probable carboxylesterase 15 [Panicum virgatum]